MNQTPYNSRSVTLSSHSLYIKNRTASYFQAKTKHQTNSRGNIKPIQMAKAKSMKRSNSVIKVAVRALQRSLSRPGRPDEFVPEDVKEGHFAVLAINDEEPRRFIVSLSCLSHPVFLKLLELAEEEFGFNQEGALAIPCKASELERIIESLERLRGGRGCY